MMQKGKFIVFEGVDGSGKTTQAKLLVDLFKKNKIPAVYTKEPSKSKVSVLIKNILKEKTKINAAALQLLFAADRTVHLEKEIIPQLEKGITVVCDRYFFSSLAYGKMSGVSLEWLMAVNSTFLSPDLVIFVDALPSECIRRINASRDKKELFEKEEKLSKTRENFLLISKKFNNFFIVDGNKSITEINKEIMAILKL